MDESHAFTENMELYINTYFLTCYSVKYLFSMESSGATICPPEVSRWREALEQR